VARCSIRLMLSTPNTPFQPKSVQYAGMIVCGRSIVSPNEWTLRPSVICSVASYSSVCRQVEATPYRSGPSRTWIKVKKSEGSCGNSRHRRHLLRGFPPFSVVPLSVRGRTKIHIHLCANERNAKIGAALDPQRERGPDLTPSPSPRRSGPSFLQRIMTLTRRESDLRSFFFSIAISIAVEFQITKTNICRSADVVRVNSECSSDVLGLFD